MFKHDYEVRKFPVPLWQWGCPLLLQSHSLVKEKKKGALFACCRFENLSTQAVVSLTVSLSCVRKDWFPALPVESLSMMASMCPSARRLGRISGFPCRTRTPRSFPYTCSRCILLTAAFGQGVKTHCAISGGQGRSLNWVTCGIFISGKLPS